MAEKGEVVRKFYSIQITKIGLIIEENEFRVYMNVLCELCERRYPLGMIN